MADRQVPRTPWDLPGYRLAVNRECFVRAASYLEISETVVGFELRPLHLRDYLALRAMAHPLLVGGDVTPAQLLAFLWLLSPDYCSSTSRRRKYFARSGLIPPRQPRLRLPLFMRFWKWRTIRVLERVDKVLTAARQYIDEALQDYPGSQLQGPEVSYWGEGAAICAGIARVYHWSEAEILNLPMKRVLQYLKEIVGQDRGPAALSNPSDQVKAEFLKNWNRAAATAGTGTNGGGRQP